MRAGGDNGPERAPPGPPRASRRPPALGSAPLPGWLASALAPGLSSAVRSPCRAPGLQEELEPGCSTTPRPGTRRPGAGSAGQVTSRIGLGAPGGPGAALPGLLSRAGAGSRSGCVERERNFGVTSPNRLLPRGRCDTGTLSPSFLDPPRLILPLTSPIRSLGTTILWLPPWLSRAPLSPWQGLLGTCWPRRPALSPVLPVAPQPLARGRQARLPRTCCAF